MSTLIFYSDCHKSQPQTTFAIPENNKYRPFHTFIGDSRLPTDMSKNKINERGISKFLYCPKFIQISHKTAINCHYLRPNQPTNISLPHVPFRMRTYSKCRIDSPLVFVVHHIHIVVLLSPSPSWNCLCVPEGLRGNRTIPGA